MTTLFFILGMLVIAALWWIKSRYADFLAQRPHDYANQTPRLDIRERLDGKILCEGVIYGPTGRVASRFVADMNAVWKGDTCTMTERFRYDSGTVQDREWVLHLGQDDTITATAPDVIGQGHGQQAGCAVQLTYRIKLQPNAGGHVLDVTDWMYLVDNGTIINRSQFRKYGIKVAELVATMRRV